MKTIGGMLYIVTGGLLVAFALVCFSLRGYVPQDSPITKIVLPIGISALLGVGLLIRGIVVLAKKK